MVPGVGLETKIMLGLEVFDEILVWPVFNKKCSINYDKNADLHILRKRRYYI